MEEEMVYDEKMFSEEDLLLIMKEKESIDIFCGFWQHGEHEESIEVDSIEAQKENDVFDANIQFIEEWLEKPKLEEH